jgi:hypothetical protein
MKSRNSLQAKNWPSIIDGPNFWSTGCVKPCLLNIKIFFQNIGLHSSCKGPKVLRLISEFQPMRSTNFDNLRQQNGLDSSCKAALRGTSHFNLPPISIKCYLTLTRCNTYKAEHFRWRYVHLKDILGLPKFQSLAMC